MHRKQHYGGLLKIIKFILRDLLHHCSKCKITYSKSVHWFLQPRQTLIVFIGGYANTVLTLNTVSSHDVIKIRKNKSM